MTTTLARAGAPARRTGRPAAARGFGLVEAMVSMALLVLALLGVAQMQITAAGANASARNMMHASQLALQMGEAVQYWAFTDPRLNPGRTVTGAEYSWTPVDTMSATLPTAMDYSLGDYLDDAGNATNPNKRGADPLLPPASVDGTFRIYWNVSAEDRNNDAVPEAKIVQIVVRWSERGLWRNVNFVQGRFNLAALRPL